MSLLRFTLEVISIKQNYIDLHDLEINETTKIINDEMKMGEKAYYGIYRKTRECSSCSKTE